MARKAMMGPHNDLQLNETLLIMAWIRHLYTGPVEGRGVADARSRRQAYTPYKLPEGE